MIKMKFPTCLCCGEVFQTLTRDKYCSKSACQTYKRRKQAKTNLDADKLRKCGCCGEMFSDKYHPKNEFCARAECQKFKRAIIRKLYREKVDEENMLVTDKKVCLHCGKDMTGYHVTRLYCYDTECEKVRLHPSWKREARNIKVIAHCRNCNVEIDITRYRNRSYCTKAECQRAKSRHRKHEQYKYYHENREALQAKREAKKQRFADAFLQTKLKQGASDSGVGWKLGALDDVKPENLRKPDLRSISERIGMKR